MLQKVNFAYEEYLSSVLSRILFRYDLPVSCKINFNSRVYAYFLQVSSFGPSQFIIYVHPSYLRKS